MTCSSKRSKDPAPPSNRSLEGLEFGIDKVREVFEALRDNMFHVKRVHVTASSNAIAKYKSARSEFWVEWAEKEHSIAVMYNLKSGSFGLYSDATNRILVGK